MFVLTTNLIDRDLSPFSLAEVGLLCCRFLPGSLPPPHTHTSPHTVELQIYSRQEGGGFMEGGAEQGAGLEQGGEENQASEGGVARSAWEERQEKEVN